jgi:molybdopterin-guanine dinucleotide biosynthesis protein A
MDERLIVAVLAGGEGRRMGGVKALRMFRGAPLLAHAVSLARRWSVEVVVVVRDAEQAGAQCDAPLIFDAPGVAGPLAGLAAALAYARAQGAALLMTLPCDMPGLPADLPARLTAALASGSAVALPQIDGQLEPACGLWRVEATDALAGYLATGRSSLQGFATAAGLSPAPFGPDDAADFANANTVEALAALEARPQL